jgi:hypothetical protein
MTKSYQTVNSDVDFNTISTNQAAFQPKKPNGYNPAYFNPIEYFGL